jgi:hypothetical protein
VLAARRTEQLTAYTGFSGYLRGLPDLPRLDSPGESTVVHVVFLRSWEQGGMRVVEQPDEAQRAPHPIPEISAHLSDRIAAIGRLMHRIGVTPTQLAS